MAVAVAVLSLAAVGSCGSDDGDGDGRNADEIYPTEISHDGQSYLCFVYDDAQYEQGGLWCERTGPG